ncbi:hypothetical protein [Flavobacterium sp. 3HN19-14]|uniref:hypothetical protein n=1 Tax=Flavobacterium sp. 3HN19-14 TaxID=3448133 RepID=UPI003EE0F344
MAISYLDSSVSAAYEAYTLTTSVPAALPYYFATRARIGGSNAGYTHGGSNGTDGGNWDGNSFINGFIFVPLANDECSSAQQIQLNTITSSTNLDSSISPIDFASCANGGSYDTWYTFNSANFQALTLNVNPTNSNTNVRYAVYSGDCNTMNEIFCSSEPTLQMSGLSENTTYYIRVFRHNRMKQEVLISIFFRRLTLQQLHCQTLSMPDSTRTSPYADNCIWAVLQMSFRTLMGKHRN